MNVQQETGKWKRTAETKSGNGRRQTKSIYYGLGPVEKLVSEIIGVYVNR